MKYVLILLMLLTGCARDYADHDPVLKWINEHQIGTQRGVVFIGNTAVYLPRAH